MKIAKLLKPKQYWVTDSADKTFLFRLREQHLKEFNRYQIKLFKTDPYSKAYTNEYSQVIRNQLK